MGETFEQLSARAHSGHWSFDELLDWYYERGKEIQRLRGDYEKLKRHAEDTENMLKDVIEENQRLRGLLERAYAWMLETDKTGEPPEYRTMIEIEKELSDG
jgi:hypothetical protein